MTVMIDADTTMDTLKLIFDDAAFDTSIDGDGDLYLKGDSIDFPIWIRLNTSKMLYLTTYLAMKPEVAEFDALKFINYVNRNIILPNFYLVEGENNFVMWAGYYMPTNFSVDKRSAIASARRFAGAFRAALNEDSQDLFFE